MLKYLLTTRSLCVCAATLALLGSTAARAQAPDTVRGLQIQRIGEGISPNLPISMYCGPYRRSGPSALVYINGQLSNDSALARLNPDDVAAIMVLKESDTRKLNPDTVQAGSLLITTKAGEHTHAVRAFNRRLAKMDLMPPAGPK